MEADFLLEEFLPEKKMAPLFKSNFLPAEIN
jgi:hypothetical protein